MLQNSDLFLNAVEKDSLDLAFQSSGIDQCVCGNIFGPRIRRYYLIHFVLDGFGVLQIEEKKYPVKPGQAFLIPAGVNAAYRQISATHGNTAGSVIRELRPAICWG